MSLQPYTRVARQRLRNGKWVDRCYFGYGDKEEQVRPTQYAVLQLLLLGDGFEPANRHHREEVYRERSKLHRRAYDTRNKRRKQISKNCAAITVSQLRGIIRRLSPDLEISDAECSHAHLQLFAASRDVETDLQPHQPEDGTYVFIDRAGRRHLFMDKREILDGTRPLSANLIVTFTAILFRGNKITNRYSAAFKEVCDNALGKEVSPTSFNVCLSKLRAALKDTNWTISKQKSQHYDEPFRVIPNPDRPIQSAAETATPALTS